MTRRIGATLAAVAIAAITVGATFTALCGNGTSCAYNGTEPRPGYQTFEKIRTNFNDHETRILALETRIRVATVTLTDAQIKALPTTSIALVAAPGSGKRIALIKAEAFGTFVGGYTNIDADGYWTLTMGATEGVASYMVNDAGATLADLDTFLQSTTRPRAVFMPWAMTREAWGTLTAGQANGAADINVALNLFASNGSDYTGGNAGNSLKVRVLYTVETD